MNSSTQSRERLIQFGKRTRVDGETRKGYAGAMQCRLCGEDKKLVRAHVIPKSFHRIDPTDPKPLRLVTNVPGRYSQNIPIGVYDAELVCLDCERLFSPWDDYADEIFLKRWSEFVPIREAGIVAGYQFPTPYDYAKLKLFFLSVLWRAAVSGHAVYRKVDLGPREPVLRSAVRNADPGDENFFGVVLQAFDDTNVGFLDPHPERFFGARYYRFYFAHVIAFIKSDSRPVDPNLQSLALAPNRPLVTSHKNFAASPERRAMRQLVLRDVANRPR